MTKVKFNVYLDQELLDWVEDQVRKGKFKSISEGIRKCLQKCVRLEETHDEA